MPSGTFKNLKILTSSNTAATITADELVLGDGNGNSVRLFAVNVSYATGTSGANGLDTGSIAVNTGYHEWVIYNPSVGTVASLLSLSGTAPTLPSGYTFRARVGWSYVDSGTHLRFKIQYGRDAQYIVGTNPTAALVVASGSAGSVTVPTYTSASVSSFVPPTASKIKVGLTTTGASTSHAVLAPNASYGANTTNSIYLSITNNAVSGSNTTIVADMMLESSNIYYAADSSLCSAQCLGWTDNL
jgi:hypothetical protein